MSRSILASAARERSLHVARWPQGGLLAQPRSIEDQLCVDVHHEVDDLCDRIPDHFDAKEILPLARCRSVSPSARSSS
jgi:hypothetical protein